MWVGCFNKDTFMQTVLLLRVKVNDDCSLMMSKRQRPRRKIKSKRKFIPATSFLITVIEVQQKKSKREERANSTRMSTKAKSRGREKMFSLANMHTIYILTGHGQEKNGK